MWIIQAGKVRRGRKVKKASIERECRLLGLTGREVQEEVKRRAGIGMPRKRWARKASERVSEKKEKRG